jgi:hypothetical protein
VFTTAERAEDFCRKMRKKHEARRVTSGSGRRPSSFFLGPRINWRTYNFELDRDEEQL